MGDGVTWTRLQADAHVQQHANVRGMSVRRCQRLTADDWIEAALAAMAEGGVSAVAIESLAARLGATKGSFYWHFSNRDALIVAALQRWEERHAQEIVELVETEPDPVRRLREMFGRVMHPAGHVPLEARLLADADHSLVSGAVRRVVATRIDYLVHLLGQLGFAADEARYRAALLYTAYVGHEQLALRLPSVLPADEGYPESVVAIALSGLDGAAR
jgi:AcrR family transcriptional regulator